MYGGIVTYDRIMVAVVKCRCLPCLENPPAGSTGAINEIPDGIEKREWLSMKCLDCLHLAGTQVL